MGASHREAREASQVCEGTQAQPYDEPLKGRGEVSTCFQRKQLFTTFYSLASGGVIIGRWGKRLHGILLLSHFQQ